MIKGKTKTGFNYSLKKEVLDDWELLEILREIDKGNPQYSVDAVIKLLGKKQYERLKNHIKNSNGRISTEAMTKELSDIIMNNQKTKN